LTVSCPLVGDLQDGGPAGRTGALLGNNMVDPNWARRRAVPPTPMRQREQISGRPKQKADGKGERARVRMPVGSVMAVVTFHLAHF
jgi:hypothetical protein